ncbi:MAG: Reverse transcriptase (RNA-dependent DNA polymerase) [Syntrophorhabdus sp. PtaU1.Bin153]|nr:MAG: Reverse transcriptase (RNA-dependent DNA polymerase) [Syntrophorhabdus sp. PtaU1.Bin153]
MGTQAKGQSKSQTLKNKDFDVLAMSCKKARAFFLKPESYCNIDLPSYFNFKKILSSVAKILDKRELSSMSRKPYEHEGVNYSLLSNKDGRYAWRPFQLIHPALYVSLVNYITEQKNWEFIRARFKKFHVKNCRCLSIPIKSKSKRKDKAAQILRWWQEIEQKSIELSIEYEYIFHADITDCYGSIYTHSIAWALHNKEIAKINRGNQIIGNIIDRHIQNMRHGQTNGIPQGSVLMDFIAEMVLGYADLQLNNKLDQAGIGEYQILRYRDDYSVFVNNPQTGEAVLKALTEVLIGLGLKLNTSKTTGAQSVISNSLKADKLAWLRARQEDENLEKHLLIIHAHGLDYPNAGSLLQPLQDYMKRLSHVEHIQNPLALISIAVDIAFNSPRTFPVVTAIVSRLLLFLKSDEECAEVIKKVHAKLSRFPSTGLMEVWLQRIGHFYGIGNYEEKLCHIVTGKEHVLWNNDWITLKEMKEAINPADIFDKVKFKAMKPIVQPFEIDLFNEYY